jgi:hypothetical protein
MQYVEKIKFYNNTCICENKDVTMVECFYDKLLALDFIGCDEIQKTKAHDTPNYNFINEHGFYPLFCKCYNCNKIISFHKLEPKHKL